MRKQLLWLYLAVGVSAHADTLPLNKAKEIAVQNNFDAQAAMQKLEAAKAKVAGSYAPYYPKIGVAGGYEFEGREEEERQTSVGYAYMQYNLFNGFADRYAQKAADLEVRQAQIEFEKYVFEIGLNVESQYHQYLYHQARTALVDDAIKRNKELLQAARRLRGQGVVSEADLLSFQISGAELESERHSIINMREESRVGLLRILGSTGMEKIEPVGTLSHAHVENALMDYLEVIRNKSFPIKLAAIIAEIKEHEWRQVRAEWLPKVDLEVRGGYLPLDELEGEEETGTNISLIASWELFSGLGTRRKNVERKARLAQSELLLKQEILNVVTQAEIRYRRLKTLETRIDLESGNIQLANKFYETLKREYMRGYKSSSDLSTAVERVLRVEMREADYLWEFLRERIELERLTGVPVKTKHSPRGHTLKKEK